MTDAITLIHRIQTGIDSQGDPVMTEYSREVFAEMTSVGMKEFYQAAAVGLQPELKFTLQDYLDYEGEQFLEHDGRRYRVLRTYRTGQRLEITCTREVNTNGRPEVSH